MADAPCLIDRYADRLPVTPRTPRLTLGEGRTPLVRAPRLERETGIPEVWLKVEGMNPTGSFKDRGMCFAMSKAVEQDAAAVICASTGNTSAAAAAYAARAGLTCAVIIPGGKIALGKLAQALIYGAKVLAVDGNFDDALRIVRELSEKHPIALVNSLNPFRLEGQKTAAFEVCDALGDAPDVLCTPVGNAGNISAYWMGFGDYRDAGRSTRLPRMMGFQAEGAAPLVRGAVVSAPETIATAIRIGNPVRGEQAMAAMTDSGGGVDSVTDEEILAAYRMLASSEGVFCEPSSASCVAGLIRAHAAGRFTPGERVVCVLTGNGLKDPDTAISQSGGVTEIPADYAAAEKALYGD